MNVTIHYTIAQIAKITKGAWLHQNQSPLTPSSLVLDSRKINNPGSTIFFAIKTKQQNANLFIESMYERGVRNFITDEKNFDSRAFPLANIILVDNTIKALQRLAAFHRKQFKNIPIIGITGSNGKTIVKEWLNQLLAKEFEIARSPKSFNSQIGVPLSILNMDKKAELGIFEAGISLPGEMKKLEKMIAPGIGIVTNIGSAHEEGFKNREQKIQEKLCLFKNASQLVCCTDNNNTYQQIIAFKKKNDSISLFTWGKKKGNTLQIKAIHKFAQTTTIQTVFDKHTFSITIPFTDEAALENAINCCCVLFILGKTSQEVLKRFNNLYPVAMRLELKPGINHCTIINDSYSNDLQSLSIALDFLNQQKQGLKRTLIFSDILQSGIKPEELYKQVASLLQQHHINYFFGIGEALSRHQKEFRLLKNKIFFKDTDDFLKKIPVKKFREEIILIKGARPFQFEKIDHALEKKVHQTKLNINLNNVVFNLKKYREILKPSTKIMIMVKAFGYGNGSYQIAAVLEYNKADYLAVAYADEGIELRKAGITLPIMVMNADTGNFDSIVNNNLEPEIFSFRILTLFIGYLKSNEIDYYPIHIKIDTGMHRLGFTVDEMRKLCKIISQNGQIKVKSVFSHLAASNEPKEDAFTKMQFNILKQCAEQIRHCLPYSFDTHIANTAAISRLPELQLDMVRLGIGLYGIDTNVRMQHKLKNVTTLTTTISQIKKIKAGETVGYGRKAKLTKDSTIATVGIGYADGYSQSLGNGIGKMMVRNQLAPVVGNVCMDMAMLDITGIKNVKEGEEVIVFGETISLQKIAAWANKIPYEIMTGISQRVKRIYFEE